MVHEEFFSACASTRKRSLPTRQGIACLVRKPCRATWAHTSTAPPFLAAGGHGAAVGNVSRVKRPPEGTNATEKRGISRRADIEEHDEGDASANPLALRCVAYRLADPRCECPRHARDVSVICPRWSLTCVMRAY